MSQPLFRNSTLTIRQTTRRPAVRFSITQSLAATIRLWIARRSHGRLSSCMKAMLKPSRNSAAGSTVCLSQLNSLRQEPTPLRRRKSFHRGAAAWMGAAPLDRGRLRGIERFAREVLEGTVEELAEGRHSDADDVDAIQG